MVQHLATIVAMEDLQQNKHTPLHFMAHSAPCMWSRSYFNKAGSLSRDIHIITFLTGPDSNRLPKDNPYMEIISQSWPKYWKITLNFLKTERLVTCRQSAVKQSLQFWLESCPNPSLLSSFPPLAIFRDPWKTLTQHLPDAFHSKK